MKTIIKKAIILVLMTIGFVILIADSDKGFIAILTIKLVGIILLCSGIQLCATWKLFKDYLDND